MRLLRLELTDVAGLAHAHATFPTEGASVLPAPNEQGKSTLVRALDALLTLKASANRDETRALKPVGRDVASVVSAELLLGGERLRLTKHFNLSGRGRGRTELEFLDGGGTLTGDAAHERFRERFEEHVDPALHELLLLRQERALEALAAGSSRVVNARLAAEVETEGADDALLTAVADAAKAHYDGRSKSPKPLGELKRATETVADLTGRRATLAAHVARGPGLTERLATIDAELATLEARRLAIDAEVARRREHAQAALEVERARLAVERGEARVRILAAAADAASALATARREAADAAAALDSAVTEHGAAEAAVAAAEAALTALRARAAGVRARRARDLVAERDRLQALVDGDPVDPAMVGRADALDVALARDEAALAGSAWRVRAVAGRALRVVIDGEEIELAAGSTLERDVVAGFGHVGEDWTDLSLVAPGETELLAASVRERRAELAGLLEGAGVGDVAALRARGLERTAVVEELATAERTLADLVGDDRLEDVLAAAGDAGTTPPDATAPGDAPAPEGAGPPEGPSPTSTAEAERALDAARSTLAAATAARERRGEERDRAEARLAAAVESAAAAERTLEDARAERPDAAVDEEARQARDVLDALPATPAADGVDADTNDPEEARRRIDERRTQLAEERGAVESERLTVARHAGELEDLDVELASASEALERRQRDARATVRLAERLRSARDAQAGRYREPLRARISTHLTDLLGTPATVELDEALAIVARERTGEGRVPWPALSVGAREQLTVLTGLAMAELAGEDGVPFLLDDAIVHSDAERARALARLLSRTSAQVIVLTCREELLGTLPRAEHELVPSAPRRSD